MSKRTLPIIIIAVGVVLMLGLVLVLRSTASDTGTAVSEASTTVPQATTSTVAPTTTQGTSTTTEAPDDSFPVTVDAPNGPVTIDKKPVRIVSISPTSTEVLFAVGAASQVVAVDDQSNYPPEVPITNLSAFTPNVEAIAAFDPDLVFLSFDPGDVIASLEAVGIPVILHPPATTIENAYAQWEQTGLATGNLAGSVALVSSTTNSLSTVVADLPEGTDELSYYYELDPTFFSATSTTFIGSLFALTGMANIADEADPDGFGFPQLTAEYIIGSDPTLIYLADTKCCGQNLDEVAERPGWNAMAAVQSGNVIELDDDIASRWGPRISDLLEVIVASISDLETADA